MHLTTEYPTSIRQPEDLTTGVVWSEVLAQTASPAVLVNRAHFLPGARTCWHEHPHGQILIIEAGVALVQERGGPVNALPQGARVVCEPGVQHWHGAAPGHVMTQFAVTGADDSRAYATWGDQVTDEEYAAGTSPRRPGTTNP